MDRLLSCPFWSRTGVWSIQCRFPWRFRTRSSWLWLTCPSLCSDRCSGPTSAELCLEAHSCSSWTRLSTCSLLCNDRWLGRQSRKLWKFHSCSFVEVVQFLDRLLTRPLVCNVMRVVQTVQKTMMFLQLQLSDGFVPGDPGSFRALDDEEFFVIEGSLVALTPGVYSQVLGLR